MFILKGKYFLNIFLIIKKIDLSILIDYLKMIQKTFDNNTVFVFESKRELIKNLNLFDEIDIVFNYSKNSERYVVLQYDISYDIEELPELMEECVKLILKDQKEKIKKKQVEILYDELNNMYKTKSDIKYKNPKTYIIEDIKEMYGIKKKVNKKIDIKKCRDFKHKFLYYHEDYY